MRLAARLSLPTVRSTTQHPQGALARATGQIDTALSPLAGSQDGLVLSYRDIGQSAPIGKRIGVLAALSTTMPPTNELVGKRSNGHPEVKVEAHVREGAFEVPKAGDVARDDELVRAGARIEPLVDVVILAQASMARVVTAPGTTSRVSSSRVPA
jgi:hypothetical protein